MPHRVPSTASAASTAASDALEPKPIVVIGDAGPRSVTSLGAGDLIEDDDLVDEEDAVRHAHVGSREIELYGAVLAAGDRIDADFTILPARGTREPLSGARIRGGLVLMTTLPNIHAHACAAQIVQTEALVRAHLSSAEILHVASDGPECWAEVDHYHADVRAPGYSLQLSRDGDVFRNTFGVGVRGSDRIARGLFSFYRGVVLAADVPLNQMRTPDVRRFVERTRSLLHLLAAKENR